MNEYYVSQASLEELESNLEELLALHPDEPETRARELEALIRGFITTVKTSPD